LRNHHYQSIIQYKGEELQPKARPACKKKKENPTRYVVKEKKRRELETNLSRSLGELDAKNEVAVTDCRRKEELVCFVPYNFWSG